MRLTLRNVSPLLAVVSFALAISCGGDAVTDPTSTTTNNNPTGGQQNPTTPTTPSTPLNTDQLVSDYLAEMRSGQSAVSQSATAAAGSGVGRKVPMPSAVSGGRATYSEGPAVCERDATNVRFTCPKQITGNVLSTVWFQLLDKDGKATMTMDTAVVVAIRRVTTTTGFQSQPGPNGTTNIDTLNNSSDMVLTNLKATNHTMNGTSKLSVVIVPEVRPVGHSTADSKTKDLVLAKTGNSFYPTAGTVTATVVSQTTGFPSSTTTQVTTYDGSKIATLTITLQNGQKRVCTWDMTVLNAAPACVTP